jgi:NitT/TauT family transport system ATP-binding protein
MKLEVHQLEKIYQSAGGPTQALLPTSFEVGDAEFVSLVGPSGCGKSTTLYIIAGLEEASGGEVLLDGERVEGPCRERGMVFQNYTLFPWLTVRQNAQFCFELDGNRSVGMTTAEARTRVDRVDSLLELMGLEKFHNAFPRELSGGMKQRVAIARALANRPKVLLMDEPFGALDAQTREEMQEMLLLLSRHEKTTILFVTHDVEEAIYLSTRILIFSPRPGRLSGEIKVPFGTDRPMEIKLDPRFLRLKREIHESLHHGDAAGQRHELLRRLAKTGSSPIPQ